MRIISLNLNGIRSSTKKGVLEWLLSQEADVICMQEVRIQPDQLTKAMIAPTLEGEDSPYYQSYFHCAERKGYSGVGVYYRKDPDRIQEGIGWEVFDKEGRFLQLDYGNLSIISLYLPSGSAKEIRQVFKYETMDYLSDWMKECKASGREVLVCGDWNIAHKECDLKNWKANQKNSGFLPEEREWLTHIFDEVGYVDVFRTLNQEKDQYTWWSNRGRAWANNVGWRIDYQIATPGIAQCARTTSIYKNERYSDHSPLIVDYDYTL